MVEAQDARVDARTGLIELAETECWELLRSHAFGRVAVTVGTTPDIFPVSYRMRDDEIIIRTEAGTKLAAGTLMPAIAFEIDDVDVTERCGWSVVVHGRGREPETLDEILALDELGLDPWVDAPKSRWLAIRPMRITGRRIGPPH